MAKKNIGSNFDDFLQEESMLEEATAVAIKSVIAWQIAKEMKAQSLTKTQLASKMGKQLGFEAGWSVLKISSSAEPLYDA